MNCGDVLDLIKAGDKTVRASRAANGTDDDDDDDPTTFLYHRFGAAASVPEPLCDMISTVVWHDGGQMCRTEIWEQVVEGGHSFTIIFGEDLHNSSVRRASKSISSH